MKRLLAGLLLTSCGVIGTGGNTGGGSSGGGGAGGGTSGFTLPSLPPVSSLAVFAPVGAGATKLLADVSNARVELDPTQRDALTALGECADLLSYCYAPPSFTLATCFSTVRGCATSQPWTEDACCPAACRDAFTREVTAGLAPKAALEKVLFREPDCFPGVRAALEAP
jgi:hypothetical protein